MGQDLVLHPQQFLGLHCGVPGLGHDGRHPVADVADLLSEHLAVIGRRLGEALTGLVVVDVGAVLVGQDVDHPGHLLGLGGVDRGDIGVGMGRAHHLQDAGPGLDHVLDEGLLAPGQLRAVHLAGRLAHHAHLLAEGRSHRGAHEVRVGQPLGSQIHGLEELLIARAATEDAREGVGDLVPGGVGRALEEALDGHHHGGRAVAALHHSGVHQGGLDHAERPVLREMLHRLDPTAIQLGRHQQAGVDRAPVHQDRTGPAHPLAVAAVADGDHADSPQQGIGVLAGIDCEFPLQAVEFERDLHALSPRPAAAW